MYLFISSTFRTIERWAYVIIKLISSKDTALNTSALKMLISAKLLQLLLILMLTLISTCMRHTEIANICRETDRVEILIRASSKTIKKRKI